MPQPWRDVWSAKTTMEETQTPRLRKTWSLLPRSVRSRQQTPQCLALEDSGPLSLRPIVHSQMFTTFFLSIMPRCSSAGPKWDPI